MSKDPSKDPNAEAGGRRKGRAGAKEVLTQDLARKIALMVGQFPDTDVAVTWDNVMEQTKLRFGREFKRNVLSQKSWGGRKLIAEAFREAKAIQSRQDRDTAPKYANEPRSRLRLVVAKLQAENMALREQLTRVRAVQYDEIHALLDTRTPLNRLVALRAESPQGGINDADSKAGSQAVLPMENARANRARRKSQTDVGDDISGKEATDNE